MKGAHRLPGGPLIRCGGKGRNGALLLPHFARARSYVEPHFGAGGMFFKIPEGTYHHEAVNDLEADLITFFKVLRQRPQKLARVLAATPFARAEFEAALASADTELETARRVFIRTRQGFAGRAGTVGNWGRSPGTASSGPRAAESALAALHLFAARLRTVAIDNIDGSEFIDRWGKGDTMIYCDPPYVHAARSKTRCYVHEMTDDDHRRLGAALHGAVARGCKAAISGYGSKLYDEELFAGWRRLEFDVALSAARDTTGMRRTEVLWCSYSEADALGAALKDAA